MESSFLGLNVLWWMAIILILAALSIFVATGLGGSSKLYYPAINIGNGGYSESSTDLANYGIAQVSINSNPVNTVPSGFTFIGDWTFKPEFGQTGGSVTLTNSNKTAYVMNSFTTQGILVGNKSLSGKVMYSVNMTYPGQTPGCNGLGIATNSFNAVAMSNIGTGPDIGYVGYDNKSFAIYDNGVVIFDDTNPNKPYLENGPIFQKTNGSNLVDVAIDIPNLKIWFRVDNGPWNNKDNHNPSTNIGGYDISKLT